MHRLLLPLAALVLFAAGTAWGDDAERTVTVYQLSGTVHCLPRGGTPPEKAADLLRAQGVKVLTAERRSLPIESNGLCGAPTGEANVLSVAAADWTAFTNQNPDAAGYGIWVFDRETVEVYRYDGTLQCGLGEEVSLERMAEDLRAAGIEVIGSRKGTDGLAHIAVCGASTGAINIYTIARESLPAAQAASFRLLVTQEMTQAIKPRLGRPVGLQSRSLPAGDRDRSPDPIPLLW